MKKWVVKAIVQKVISGLPMSHRINYLFQKYVTRGVILNEDYFFDKIQHAHDHLKYFRRYSATRDFSSLEIGTGWYPVVPISMFLAGADEAVTVDITRLLNAKSLRQTVRFYQDTIRSGRIGAIREYFYETRLESFLELNPAKADYPKLLQELKLTPMVTDARRLPFADNYFDLIHSNNTFEHIYPEILESILQEFKRVLKKGGVMSHFVDMSDHFAHLDVSITIYNFLKYDERDWRRIDNSVQPQNRLRLADYEKMYRDLEWDITDKDYRPGAPETVRQLGLDEVYSQYSAEDLAISHAHLVNVK